MVRDGARPIRSWPLLLLAFPAAAEVWSGWVGIAQKTGFGLVHPLPGIWSSLHLDTTITLPIGIEAFAAYALRARLATEPWISPRTRRFAKWSAIWSFLLGMAHKEAYDTSPKVFMQEVRQRCAEPSAGAFAALRDLFEKREPPGQIERPTFSLP